MSIAEEKVSTVTMQAIKLIHVTTAPSRSKAFARMTESHSRTSFRNALGLCIVVLRKQDSVRDRANPCGPPKLMRPFTGGNRLTAAVSNFPEPNLAITEKYSVAIDARLGRAEHGDVV